jgi:hypothetical protein
MAGKSGQDVQKEIISKNPDLSVVLVGKDTDFNVDIFHVLKQLKLAQNFHDEVSKDAGAAKKDKDKELKTANPNLVKDKKTGQQYLVDPLPSVIISVTGDAQDVPEDHEFIASVDDLMKYMGESRGVLKLNREAASRAISMMTANRKEKISKAVEKIEQSDLEQAWKDKANAARKSSMCMQISLLIQVRMLELESKRNETFKDSTKRDYTFSEAFKNYPSARDVMLNVSEEDSEDKEGKVEKAVEKLLKTLNNYCFTADDEEAKGKPVVTGKRLSKARWRTFSRVLACICCCLPFARC